MLRKHIFGTYLVVKWAHYYNYVRIHQHSDWPCSGMGWRHIQPLYIQKHPHSHVRSWAQSHCSRSSVDCRDGCAGPRPPLERHWTQFILMESSVNNRSTTPPPPSKPHRALVPHLHWLIAGEIIHTWLLAFCCFVYAPNINHGPCSK